MSNNFVNSQNPFSPGVVGSSSASSAFVSTSSSSSARVSPSFTPLSSASGFVNSASTKKEMYADLKKQYKSQLTEFEKELKYLGDEVIALYTYNRNEAYKGRAIDFLKSSATGTFLTDYLFSGDKKFVEHRIGNLKKEITRLKSEKEQVESYFDTIAELYSILPEVLRASLGMKDDEDLQFLGDDCSSRKTYIFEYIEKNLTDLKQLSDEEVRRKPLVPAHPQNNLLSFNAPTSVSSTTSVASTASVLAEPMSANSYQLAVGLNGERLKIGTKHDLLGKVIYQSPRDVFIQNYLENNYRMPDFALVIPDECNDCPGLPKPIQALHAKAGTAMGRKDVNTDGGLTCVMGIMNGMVGKVTECQIVGDYSYNAGHKVVFKDLKEDGSFEVKKIYISSRVNLDFEKADDRPIPVMAWFAGKPSEGNFISLPEIKFFNLDERNSLRRVDS